MSNGNGLDYQTLTIAIDDKLNAELARLQSEGWQIMPGTVPIAVYQLQKDRGLGARGGITIDESKVHVIKAQGG